MIEFNMETVDIDPFDLSDSANKKRLSPNLEIYHSFTARCLGRGGEFQVTNSKYLMNFIGLFDKNKKELFDGDLINFKNKNMEKSEFLGFIKYDSGRACWTVGKSLEENIYGLPLFEECDNGICDADNLEVVGNKFENPEFFQCIKK